MKSYRDFDLEITVPALDAAVAAGVESLAVRVAASPAGEQRIAEATRVTVGADLRKECGRLDRRELDLARLIELGRALGDILLPPAARGYFERSRAALGEYEGLRIRLKLDTWGFADLPWEYAWLPPAGGSGEKPGVAAHADATGFLALDPRLSISRYELLSEPIGDLAPTGARQLRVVAVLAAPKDERWVPLDLGGEERGLRQALATRPEVRLEVVEEATLANLERALLEGAEVFHFAGHGRFQAAIGDKVETVAGKGFLVFRDAAGRGAEVPAETVVVNLRGRGVRLAVLGACEGARRDRINPWTGIAPALIRGGLPAAVAMQATLYDRSAIAFSTRFYEALARGLPVDAAVTAGRLAIFNESGPGERDWGVPVLYLRAETGVLFPRAGEAELSSGSEPLDRAAWVNVAFAAAALVLATLSFYLVAHPRVLDSWFIGKGVATLASAGALVAAFLQGLVGDDARRWARRALRGRFASILLRAGTGLLVALLLFLVTHRPSVLRIVPGANLVFELGPHRAMQVRVWQGEKGSGPPDWEVDLREGAGVTMGASEAVTAAALERGFEKVQSRLDAYLIERRVPGDHREWLAAWEGAPTRLQAPHTPRRRSGTAVSLELICNGKTLELERSEFPPPADLLNAWEESLELLVLEPVAPEECPRAPA